MTTKVRAVWRLTATDDLTRRYDRIAARADPDTAFACTSAIEAHTADRATYPTAAPHATTSHRTSAR